MLRRGVWMLALLSLIMVMSASGRTLTLSQQTLLDRIRGGWAGKMVGVTYGAPTEFRYRQKINEDPRDWKPVAGPPVTFGDYIQGAGRFHLWGVLGGMIRGVRTISNFVASYARMVGPATSYALGQGATMRSAVWGVFVWRKFAGAPPSGRRLLALMFLFFVLGLAAVAVAPVWNF